MYHRRKRICISRGHGSLCSALSIRAYNYGAKRRLRGNRHCIYKICNKRWSTSNYGSISGCYTRDSLIRAFRANVFQNGHLTAQPCPPIALTIHRNELFLWLVRSLRFSNIRQIRLAYRRHIRVPEDLLAQMVCILDCGEIVGSCGAATWSRYLSMGVKRCHHGFSIR